MSDTHYVPFNKPHLEVGLCLSRMTKKLCTVPLLELSANQA